MSNSRGSGNSNKLFPAPEFKTSKEIAGLECAKNYLDKILSSRRSGCRMIKNSSFSALIICSGLLILLINEILDKSPTLQIDGIYSSGDTTSVRLFLRMMQGLLTAGMVAIACQIEFSISDKAAIKKLKDMLDPLQITLNWENGDLVDLAGEIGDKLNNLLSPKKVEIKA